MKFYNKNLLLGLILFILLSVFQVKAQIVDLSTHVNNSLAPSGTNISWYTVSNPDPNNPNTNLVGSYTSSVVTSVNVTATRTATVSYTHLDVYKRQRLLLPLSRQFKLTTMLSLQPQHRVFLEQR